MCSIIGSFSKEKVKELAALNAYRGQHSHSITVFKTPWYDVVYQHKGFGPLIVDDHDFDTEDTYIVAHQQAPTTENKDEDSIHPAIIGNNMLWHNGIIKEKSIKEMQKRLNSTLTWDTKLMLTQLMLLDNIDSIDGTFSCLWRNNDKLYVFRNEISPLFVDNELNISSTKFNSSNSLEPNVIYNIHTGVSQLLKEKKICVGELNPVSTFKTVENPYYFGE